MNVPLWRKVTSKVILCRSTWCSEHTIYTLNLFLSTIVVQPYWLTSPVMSPPQMLYKLVPHNLRPHRANSNATIGGKMTRYSLYLCFRWLLVLVWCSLSYLRTPVIQHTGLRDKANTTVCFCTCFP